MRALTMLVTASLLVLPSTPALALPLPTAPTDPIVASQWANPELRPLDSASAITTSIDAINEHSITVTISNNAQVPLRDVSVRVQRAEPVSTVAQGKFALSQDQSFYGFHTGFVPVDVELAPAASHTFTVALHREELGITDPAVYPLLINVNGELSGAQQYVSSQRTLLEVEEHAADKEKQPTPLSVLIPITTTTDIVPGETGEAPNHPPLILRSEKLAQDIGHDGRLSTLVDTFDTGDPSVCLALDPEVVETVDRMTAGYQVAEDRPSTVEHKPRLRDSWGTKDKQIKGNPGTGTEDAKAFLGKLQSIAQSGGCIVPLPRANAELNAVAQTGNSQLMAEAVRSGAPSLSQLLGVPVRPDVVIPGYGYVEQSTVAALSEPTTLLVADNTIPANATMMSDNVKAVGYHSAMAAMLATMGDTPATAGFANQWQRFDYRLDSPVARRASATAAVTLAVGEGDHPVLVMPPPTLQVDDARALQLHLRHLLESGQATPLSFYDFLAQEPSVSAPAEGSPFEDPTVLSDVEVLHAQQQAKSIDDLTSLMIDAPTIALTPRGFTDPLRHDLLRALSVNGRRSMMGYASRAESSADILGRNSAILQQLRSSVVLLPPGNVYTRTSESSPLLIVAENGLPLPVDAKLSYSGPEGAKINTAESLKIPARGSITAQMTADLPDAERSDLTVWLATQAGAPISAPVDIRVQTRSGLLGFGGISALLLAVLGFVMFHVKRR